MFAAVAGLPEASFDVWCLVGRQAFLQIEMFEFGLPHARPIPEQWRPSDIGYSTLGVRVEDLDSTLERLAAIGDRPLTAPLVDERGRRVCIRDPNGILVELVEDSFHSSDTRPEADMVRPEIVSVTLSVASLDRARAFWVDVIGCQLGGQNLHTPEHEALWGLEGAVCERAVLRSGKLALELVEYSSPRPRPRPAEHRISDHGILNVAIGSTDKGAFDSLYARVLNAGLRANTEPWTVPGVATVVYLCDEEGFSVELLHVPPAALGRMGFIANDRDQGRSRGPTEPA